jgi:hypothetical protein
MPCLAVVFLFGVGEWVQKNSGIIFLYVVVPAGVSVAASIFTVEAVHTVRRAA